MPASFKTNCFKQGLRGGSVEHQRWTETGQQSVTQIMVTIAMNLVTPKNAVKPRAYLCLLKLAENNERR